MTSPKSYWSILKTFLDNKKIPCIPSLLHNDMFITNFQEKAEIATVFLYKQLSSFSSFKEDMIYCEKFTSEVMMFRK